MAAADYWNRDPVRKYIAIKALNAVFVERIPVTRRANPLLPDAGHRSQISGLLDFRRRRAIQREHAGLHQLAARPQHQVKGVAEDDLCAERLEILGRQRLDRTIGPHRHEHRRLHAAVCERQPAAARSAIGGL